MAVLVALRLSLRYLIFASNELVSFHSVVLLSENERNELHTVVEQTYTRRAYRHRASGLSVQTQDMKRPWSSGSASSKRAKRTRVFETELSINSSSSHGHQLSNNNSNNNSNIANGGVNVSKLVVERQLGIKSFHRESQYLRYKNFSFKVCIVVSVHFGPTKPASQSLKTFLTLLAFLY